MQWYQWSFLGMNVLWWGFWGLLLLGLFLWAKPVRRREARRFRDEPLSILRRRYATGEISTKEYDEHVERLERDLFHAQRQSSARRPVRPRDEPHGSSIPG